MNVFSVLAQNPSDACSAAPNLTVNSTCSTISFLLNGSYTDGGSPLSGCQSLDRDDGWYTMTGTGGFVTVKTTSSDQRHVLALYSGTCASLTLLKCEEVVIGVSSRLTISTTSGTTYYIQIHRSSGNNTASLNGTICVQSINTPGGVTNGLGSWYSADGLITTSGTTVTTWKNNVGGNPNLTNSNGTPTFTNSYVNFNPAVLFDNNDYVNGPATGATFVGNSTNTVIMANNYHSGAVIAKWEETGNFNNRVSMEGMGNNIRYDHPTDISYMINSPTVAKDNWIVSSGLGSATTDYLYINGSLEGSDAGGSNTPSALGSIMFGSNTNGSYGANTDLAEIIYYTNTLTATERNKVESYMATKYGITLGSTGAPVDYTASTGLIFWNGSTTYQNDVAGIGRDDGGNLNQRKSKSVNSDGMITMALTDLGGSFATPDNFNSNLEFMLWGNDNGSLVESGVEVPAGYSRRLPREWKVQETGTIGTVSIQFDISALTVTGTTTADFVLMVDEDKDANFLTGTIRKYVSTSYAAGILSFTGVDFNNGEIFSLITGINTLPIKFISFEGKANGLTNNLSWTVDENSTVSHFEILESLDGLTWNIIGKVKIENDGANQFNYTDYNLSLQATTYYQIKEIELNGETTYSDIVSINNGQYQVDRYITFPNPANQNLTLQLSESVNESDGVQIILSSNGGKIMLKTILYKKFNILDLSNIPPGIYLLEIISLSDSMIERRSIVIQ